MRPQLSIGVVNQVAWPKAGDVDDCAAVATMQAVLAVAPWSLMPSIKTFRAAAGNPDNQGEPDGHSIQECAKAIRQLWPEIGAKIAVSPGTLGKEKVLDAIRDGRPAMVFVRSSALPEEHQYGFGGLHACAAAHDGTAYRFANPLAPAHSRWRVIGRDQLGDALRAMPGTGAKAILMPTVEDAFTTHPLYPAT